MIHSYTTAGRDTQQDILLTLTSCGFNINSVTGQRGRECNCVPMCMCVCMPEYFALCPFCYKETLDLLVKNAITYGV